jgi:hypothetical protein
VIEDPFVAHSLFTVAYEMLGSAADAEDIVQVSWLRWADVDHSQVRDLRAYLIRIVTRQRSQPSTGCERCRAVARNTLGSGCRSRC